MTAPRVPRARLSERLGRRLLAMRPVEPPTTPPPDEQQPGSGEEEKRPGRLHLWLNTASTFMTALIAVPALCLAVITYQDQQQESEESARKEASRIAWYMLEVDGTPTDIVVENRGLRPLYRVLVNIEADNQDNRQVFYIDHTVSPCSRTTYSFGKHGPDVRGDLYSELYFEDSLDHLWRIGYWGRIKDLGEGRNLKWSEDLDMVKEWKLSPKYEDLDACG
ncbi:hypothetical protein [Streptomyces fungicidicus]|uniref:hypothetical protein n=1 Tax=Streptomyces fungicidicus TaxID=68203 RepID=UPI00381FED48